MLALTDTRWRSLKGGYRIPYDVSDALRRMETGSDVWDELWQELHHQGDVGDASYAAVPHLVRICRDSTRRDWNLYALVARIEVERHRKSNPPLPEWLAPEYTAAWRNLENMALSDLGESSNRDLIQSALAVVALARGELQVGALLGWLDDDELAAFLEEKMAWSKLYV